MSPNTPAASSAPVNPPPKVDPPKNDAPQEPPPHFLPWFAAVSAVVFIILGGVLLWRPTRTAWDLTKSDWLGDKSDEALAASLSVPLTVLGGALVLVGTWMAVVEWRGRFKEKKEGGPARGPVDFGAVIEAIGKLRGAALVLVVGAALMLASAWVASSAASSPTTPTSTTGDSASP